MVRLGYRIDLTAIIGKARLYGWPSVHVLSVSRMPVRTLIVCAQEVRQWHALATSIPPGECELLYGRAGYLYCLLYLCKHVSAKKADVNMVRTKSMRSAYQAAFLGSSLLQSGLMRGRLSQPGCQRTKPCFSLSASEPV